MADRRDGAAPPAGAVLEGLLESLAEGVVVFGAGLRVIAVNAAAERILGRPRRRLLGLPARAAHIRLRREDGRPWPEADARLEALASPGAPPLAGLSCRILRPDRAFADVVVAAAPVAWPAEPSAILLSLTDVTQRRRADLAVRDAIERLRALVDGSADGLLAVDAQGLVVELNAVAERLFGTTREDALGRPVDGFLAERGREARRLVRAGWMAGSARAAPGGVSAWVPGVGRRRDGGEFAIAVAVSALPHVSRPLLAVSIRPAGVTGPAPARRSPEPPGRVLGGLTHELRTPLNSILGFGQLLERQEAGELNDRQRRYVANVMSSGRRLLALVDGLAEARSAEAAGPGRADATVTAQTTPRT